MSLPKKMEQQIQKYNNIQDFVSTNFDTLTHLHLQINKEMNDDQEFNHFKSSLSQCTKLQMLKLKILYYMKFRQIIQLFEDLPDYENLEIISLQFFGSIYQEGASSIALFLKKCQKLTSLKLKFNNNNIQSTGTSKLVEAINSFKNLQYLSIQIGGNQIGDEGANIITLSLSKWDNLRRLQLYLYDNQISVKEVSNLGKSLRYLTQLRTLEISFLRNEISDEGALAISQGISSCTNLTKLLLYLECKKITEKGYLILDQCISGLANLLYLDCYLSQDSTLLQSREILNCKNIKQLKLCIQWDSNDQQVKKHLQNQLKIKRLVKI